MYIIHHTQNIEKYIERINSSVGPPRPRGHTGIYMRRRIYNTYMIYKRGRINTNIHRGEGYTDIICAEIKII